METRCEYSKLTIPNDLTYVPVAVGYVAAIAEKIGFDAADRQMIERAVSEVVTNIISHAFEPQEEATFDIQCERVPVGLKVTILDQGIPFEPRLFAADDSGEGSHGEGGSGPRRPPLKEWVNRVEFHNLGPLGKETVLVKYLKNRSISDYYDACELSPYPAGDASTRQTYKRSDIAVRPMRPSEAVEVSKCVYKAYGYSYGVEHLYFPDRIRALNEAGEIFSAVAVTPADELAGHVALMWHEGCSSIAELAMGAVKPEFRSQGVFTFITEFLVEKARSQGLIGIFGHAVTNHTFSQQVGLRIGEKDCALKLGFIPATASFKGITDTLAQRDSVVLHFMYLHRPSLVRVCLPSRHRDMIVRIYRNLGITSELSVADACPRALPTESAVVRVSASGRMGLARIDVERFGSNVVQEVKARLKELCFKHFDVIHLYLNLGDPLTCCLTEDFERMGFFFSGILPAACAGDALILQYLNNTAIDYEKIKVKSDMGKDLLEYVRQQDPNV